jgi:hypothetical protein
MHTCRQCNQHWLPIPRLDSICNDAMLVRGTIHQWHGGAYAPDTRFLMNQYHGVRWCQWGPVVVKCAVHLGLGRELRIDSRAPEEIESQQALGW